MFTHACSNMMMRGDGKSNIYHEDCFNAKINKTIKERKPTVSFLNPPYDGGPDEQLKFVEHSLEMLQKNGRCVAICQMSTAIKQDKRTIESRKTLLKKHPLEAVFSMPKQLFHPVGVGTCILFLTAHVPHPKQKEVFFGYFKDDGHVLMKHRGRLDNGTWEEKKEQMLSLLMNRKSEKGLSVTQWVNAEDEWCAEAYMETDYSQLKEEDFIKTIKNYIVFQFLNHDHKND